MRISSVPTVWPTEMVLVKTWPFLCHYHRHTRAFSPLIHHFWDRVGIWKKNTVVYTYAMIRNLIKTWSILILVTLLKCNTDRIHTRQWSNVWQRIKELQHLPVVCMHVQIINCNWSFHKIKNETPKTVYFIITKANYMFIREILERTSDGVMWWGKDVCR